MSSKRKQLAAAGGASEKGTAAKKRAGNADESDSEDLVSGPDDDEEDDDDEDEDDEAEPPKAAKEDEDGSGSDFDEINVDFEFFDLSEIDFHGLRALFNRYLDGAEWPISSLVEALIGQAASVGTAVKANGDVDPVGVCSVLPLGLHRANPGVEAALRFLRRHCPQEQLPALEEAAAHPRTGLLVSERMLNAPPELGPPLLEGLLQELREVGEPWWYREEKRASAELAASYRLERFLILSRCYRDDEALRAAAAAAAAGGATAAAVAPLVYPKAEDGAFHARAQWSFLFPAAVPEATAAADAAAGLTQMRLVMLVDAPGLAAAAPDAVRIVAALEAKQEDGGGAAGPLRGGGGGAAAATQGGAKRPAAKKGRAT